MSGALFTRQRYYSYQKREEPSLLFNELIREDLQNKRKNMARYNCFCSKCSRQIAAGTDMYWYGKGRRICPNCHQEAIDWLQYVIF